MPEVPAAVAALGAPLRAGALVLGEALDDTRLAALLTYLDLLARWNRAFNLTAVRAPEQMVALHLLDSLAALPFVRGRRLLDIGSGAGLPGLVVAIARPAMRCILLDSGSKKTRFCRQAVATLGLDNVEVVTARAEDYRAEPGFDTVTARAFAPLDRVVELARPHLAAGARVLALKGPRAAVEVLALGTLACHASVHEVQIPGLDARRCMVTVDGLGPACGPAQEPDTAHGDDG